jgi:hypothetical protein
MIAELLIPNIAFMVDSGSSIATCWLQVISPRLALEANFIWPVDLNSRSGFHEDLFAQTSFIPALPELI